MINWLKKKFSSRYAKELTDKQKEVLDLLDEFLVESNPQDSLPRPYRRLECYAVEFSDTRKSAQEIAELIKHQVVLLKNCTYIPRSIAFVNNGDWYFVVRYFVDSEASENCLSNPATSILYVALLNSTDDARQHVDGGDED